MRLYGGSERSLLKIQNTTRTINDAITSNASFKSEAEQIKINKSNLSVGFMSNKAPGIKLDVQVLLGGDAMKHLNELDYKYYDTVVVKTNHRCKTMFKKLNTYLEVVFKIKDGRAAEYASKLQMLVSQQNTASKPKLIVIDSNTLAIG
jgi:hypothetical protein